MIFARFGLMETLWDFTARARVEPPYHLRAGLRPAGARAILPHVPHRTAQVRSPLPAFRHHQPAAQPIRRRDHLLVHRDRHARQWTRLADSHRLRLPPLRGFHPERSCRADLAHRATCRVALLAEDFLRHHRSVLARQLAVRDLHDLAAYHTVAGGSLLYIFV